MILNNKKMSNFKFCANLGFMFTETPNFLDRLSAAHSANFLAVESPFPVDTDGTAIPLDDLIATQTKLNMKQILINIFIDKDTFGVAAIPNKEDIFKKNLDLTIKYAKALKCPKIHIMSGVIEGEVTKQHDDTFIKNLKHAVQFLEKENIIGVIEPINKYSVPNYYLNDFNKALNIINEINSNYLKLQLDIFHMQLICGNLTKNIEKFLPCTSHIQIAQVPDRGEPNTFGEINYNYIFDLLKKLNYNDYIGLEYKPKTSTLQGLDWIQHLNF